MHECKKSCQPNQKTRRKLRREVFERFKESKWGKSWKLYESNIVTHKKYSLYLLNVLDKPELYFPLKVQMT